ncbi:MAG: hypothetical protein J0M09_00610 [Xanthomonadales bacterium]|nr:hypothetical protein [Xanthomonadales bacterium]
MSFEIHMVVADNRVNALARIAVIAAGRSHLLLSSGFRSRVTFEDLDDAPSGYDRDKQERPLYCAVARVDA